MKTRFCRLSPVVSVARAAALLAAFAVFAGAAFAGVFDDAKFKLDLRGDLNDNAFIDAGEAGDAMTFSASSPLALTYGVATAKFTLSADEYASGGYDTWGKMPCIEMMSVTNSWYYRTSATVPCLRFYQDSRTVDGVKQWALCGVRVRNAAVPPGDGGCVTIYARFRWDGSTASPNLLVGNGWNALYNTMNGQSIYLDGEGKIGVIVSNRMDSAVTASPKLATGLWHDVFVTTHNETINGSLTAVSDIYVCTNRPAAKVKPSVFHGVLTNRVGCAMHWTTANTAVTFGSFLNRSGWKQLTGSDTPRAFRGAIAEAMIWNRALTDAERMEVLAGRRGAKWLVGADNDSADEFNDGTNEDIAIADPYLPESMPWNRMRKTLDASNPSLSLQSPLPFAETNKPVVLTVKPILSGTESPCRAAVSVNGTRVETINLSSGYASNLVIPGKYWQRDANGSVTVVITRLGTSGTVDIDQLALSGSWQISEENNASGGMIDQAKAPSWAFAGDGEESHFTGSMSVGNSSTNYTFGVWVPDGMGEKAGWKFCTKTTANVSNPVDGLDSRHVVYVNGTAVGSHDGWFKANEAFTLDIPAGVLHDGMNYVQWVQTLPTRADQQAVEGRPGVFQYYDYWGMTLVPPASPFTLIVR